MHILDSNQNQIYRILELYTIGKYNEAQRLEQEAMVPQKHKKKDKEITR